MFAIAFDLDTDDTRNNHPKSLTQVYADIRNTVVSYGFEWRQGSVYTCDNEDLGNLFDAMNALKAIPHGFRHQSATFAPSVSNDGRTLPPK